MLEIGSRVITKLDSKTEGWIPRIARSRRDNAIGTIIDKSDAHGLCYQVYHDDETNSWYNPHELSIIVSQQDKLDKITELSKVNHYSGQQYIRTLISTDWKSGEVRYGLDWKAECGTIEFSSLESCISILEKLRERMVP